MIAATQRWWKRNRRNLLVGAGVIGAGYLAGQYVLSRFAESRQRSKDEKASKENLEIRFRSNQQDCTYTVLALLPTIRDEILNALPVEEITEQLQNERQERLKRLAASEAASSEFPSAPPSVVDDASTASFIHASQTSSDGSSLLKPKRSKAQLWQDMKINSIARALALLYTLALLNILTRIQLNLLGRRTYLSSVVALAAPMNSSTISLEDKDADVFGASFETNRLYLTFSWWILHRGAKSILERVMAAVKDVFQSVNIREDMSMDRLSELIIEVRRKVEGATEEERRTQSWLRYLLPPREQESFVIQQAGLSDGSDSASPDVQLQNPIETSSISPSLRRLLDETADLIESPIFSTVLSHLLDAGFSHLIDVRVASEAFKTPISGEGSRITELPDLKCKLAHILPVFCRQAHSIVVGSGELDAIAGVGGNQALPNEYLAVMDQVHDLEAFAAVIYSSNFEYEAGGPDLDSQIQPSVISLSESQPLTMSEFDSVHVPAQIVEQARGPVIDPLGESAVQIVRDDAQPTQPTQPTQTTINSLADSAVQVERPTQTTIDTLAESAVHVAPPQASASTLTEVTPVAPPQTSAVLPAENIHIPQSISKTSIESIQIPQTMTQTPAGPASVPPSQTSAETLAESAVEIQQSSQPSTKSLPKSTIQQPETSKQPDFDSAWSEALAKGSNLKPAVPEKKA